MERLADLLPPEEFGAIRVFGLLPAIALSAEPGVIAWLLTQPEVAAIEPDREVTLSGSTTTMRPAVQALGQAASGEVAPEVAGAVPSETRTEDGGAAVEETDAEPAP